MIKLQDPSSELRALGIEESRDLIVRLRAGLTVLEDDTEDADFETLVKDLFRYTHTLKGVSRTIGLVEIEEITGRLESFFHEMKHSEFSRRIEDAMFSERIEVLLARIDEIIRELERDQT